MVTIKGGKILTITKGTLDNGVILIEKGKIKAIGQDISIPEGSKIINAEGKWITPGFIDCHTHISLFSEPGNMWEPTIDDNEFTAPVTSQLRALDALNPADAAIEKVRNAGFTTVYTGPGSANLIGGTGISFKLRGRTADEMIIPSSDQMKMALGENPKNTYGSKKLMPFTRMGSAALLRETLYNALNYSEKLLAAKDDPSKAPTPDFKLESLVKAVRGQQKVRIHCHRADDIMTAIRIAEEYHLNFSIEHATEGYKIADILAEKNIPCVVGPFQMSQSKQEVWEAKLENAGILADAGVKISIMADTNSPTAFLPEKVGLLLRYGLSEEDAFKAVTINPAELLGISDRTGSLEEGKDADIAIFDGHPLCNMTLCRLTMIDGVVYHNTM